MTTFQIYGTNKASVEGFGGSTPNLGDPPVLVSSNVQAAKKSKSGIVFGNNTSYNEGKIELNFNIKVIDYTCTLN